MSTTVLPSFVEACLIDAGVRAEDLTAEQRHRADTAIQAHGGLRGKMLATWILDGIPGYVQVQMAQSTRELDAAAAKRERRSEAQKRAGNRPPPNAVKAETGRRRAPRAAAKTEPIEPVIDVSGVVFNRMKDAGCPHVDDVTIVAAGGRFKLMVTKQQAGDIGDWLNTDANWLRAGGNDAALAKRVGIAAGKARRLADRIS